MFDFKNEPEPSIEGLKISELTVAQFRQVMRECLAVGRADGRGPMHWNLSELQYQSSNRSPREPRQPR